MLLNTMIILTLILTFMLIVIALIIPMFGDKAPQDIKEFNNKWRAYLEERHYGLAINNKNVIAYLDKQFIMETINNPDFKYQQIKTKFNSTCIYSNSTKNRQWEKEISEILSKTA